MRACPVVLCVEDSDDDFEMFSRAVRAASAFIAVHRVKTFAEARRFLLGEPPYQERSEYPLPQVVIAHLWLPDGTALELMRWMEAHPALRDVRYCVFTSADIAEDKEGCRDGAVSLLRRPSNWHQWNDCAARVTNLSNRVG